MGRTRIALGAALVAAIGVTAVTNDAIAGRLELLLRGNPIAGTPDSVAQGRAVYLENCAACHGVNGDGRGELAADLAVAPANFYALNRPPSVLAMRIHYGVGDEMPGWRETLDTDTIWHVVNYLNTLAQSGQGRSTNQWWRPGGRS